MANIESRVKAVIAQQLKVPIDEPQPILPDDVLFSRLLEIARQRNSQIIVNDLSCGTQFSYCQILHGTVRLKQKLEALLDRSILKTPGGCYLALLAPNGYEFINGVLAVLAVGGVVVPMLPEETPSILFFTSGTSGPPKGVLHGRRTINKYARQEVKAFEPNDELCVIPRGAFWSLYFTKLFQMLLTGIRVEIHNFGRNNNLIWEKLREQTATKIVLSPTFWYGMMTYFQDHISMECPPAVVDEYVRGAQHLRDACAAGAVLSCRIKEFWREMRGGRLLKQLYGTTETQEIALCDMEYLNSPGATSRRFDPEGFFKTGDLAILQDGRYVLTGRANMDLFKSYTYKVPRHQVEAALIALPYVAEGYIMPVADPQCDTQTAALVRLHKNYDDDIGHRKVDLQAIRNDLATEMGLPAYQLPTVLRILREHESVPLTWSDKTAMMNYSPSFPMSLIPDMEVP
ncbi:hypothetical protein BDW72DRAFT_207788 [Aspergillus terricola var. indicus]